MKSDREYLPAPELLSTITQPGLEVFQVTTAPDASTNLFYNYLQTLDPLSRFVLLSRSGKDSAHILRCDLEDDFALEPVTAKEDSVNGGIHRGVSFTPDGQWIWYNTVSDGRFRLRRRARAGGPVETVFDLDVVRPEFGGRKIINARWISFSHDGKRMKSVLCIEGKTKYYSIAILTFDLTAMALHTAFETGPRGWNNKSQYAPCLGPKGEYLISAEDCYSRAYFDEEHKWKCDVLPEGEKGNGARFLLDEEGHVRYAYPVGRDRPHQNASHSAWFGRSLAKVFHCDAFDTAPHWRGAIMHAEPIPADETSYHLGRHMPGGKQTDLTRHIKRPDVYHLYVDTDARHMICDTIVLGYGDNNAPTRYLYGSTVRQDQDGPYIEPKYILNPYSSWSPYGCECLPCMTPDGKWILFNSDYPGVNGYKGERHVPQVFAARGFEFPE